MLEQLAFGRPDRRALGWAQQLLTLVAAARRLPPAGRDRGVRRQRAATFADELRQHAASGPCARVRRRPVLPAPGYRLRRQAPGGRS